MTTNSPFISRAQAVEILTAAGYALSSILQMLCWPLRSTRWPGNDRVIEAGALVEEIERQAGAADLPPYLTRRLTGPLRDRVLVTQPDLDIHLSNLVANGMTDPGLGVLRATINQADWHSRPTAFKPGSKAWSRKAVHTQAEKHRHRGAGQRHHPGERR